MVHNERSGQPSAGHNTKRTGNPDEGADAEAKMKREVSGETAGTEPLPEGVIACGRTGPITEEARAELRDFARWLKLPKPRPEFHAWRAAAQTESETP